MLEEKYRMLVEICEMTKSIYSTLKYDEKLLSINFTRYPS